ncbi:hypothetical protein RI054_22g96650 [Pseudoscourfieldia marina]
MAPMLFPYGFGGPTDGPLSELEFVKLALHRGGPLRRFQAHAAFLACTYAWRMRKRAARIAWVATRGEDAPASGMRMGEALNAVMEIGEESDPSRREEAHLATDDFGDHIEPPRTTLLPDYAFGARTNNVKPDLPQRPRHPLILHPIPTLQMNRLREIPGRRSRRTPASGAM